MDKGVTVNVAEYKEEVYYECFPGATEEDYFDTLYYDLGAYIEQIEKGYNLLVERIRFVMIDEEYLRWIQVNQLENNDENRVSYMNQLDDEEVDRLWLKNEHDYSLTSYALPIALVSQEVIPAYALTLSEERIGELKGILCSSFKMKPDSFYLSNQMMRVDYYYRDYMFHFETLAHRHFTGEEIPTVPLKNFLASQEAANVAMRVIPMVIKEKQEAIIYVDEYRNYVSLEDAEIKEEEMDKWAEEVSSELRDRYVVTPCPSVVPGDDIIEFYKDFISSSQREFKIRN